MLIGPSPVLLHVDGSEKEEGATYYSHEYRHVESILPTDVHIKVARFGDA